MVLFKKYIIKSQKFTDEPKPSREQCLRDCKVLLPLECTSFKGTVLQKMFSLKSGQNSMVVYKNKNKKTL